MSIQPDMELFLANILLVLGHLKILAATLTIATAIYLFYRSKHIYLIDFICYRPLDTHRVPTSSFIEHTERLGRFDSETVEFQTRVLERSGIGSESYFPTGIHKIPNDQTLSSAVEEVEMVLFSVAQSLFSKHQVDPKSIDILITNCSLVCPTPSLASMIINKFGMRSNVKSFNLSGMGCSAGLLSVSLAKDLLKVNDDSLALILSMESVCSNIYNGKVKSMLLANCLFRMGGAAVLLSNRKSDKRVAKYELKHLVRSHIGATDSYYKCVIQEPDKDGFTGINLSRSLTQVAGEALRVNVSTLAVLVLPYSEQIKYILAIVSKKIWPPARKRGTYVPDFTKAFEHFCIHSGGKSVIETVKERLELREQDVEASKMTLYKFGNTSSASVWYSLSYLEAKGRVKRGDRVWQLAFGSGLKCNSAVWKSINKPDLKSPNVWSDWIHLYPVKVPDVMDH
ncbi:Very-long-chain 3-ketoacyl-CoA synthase [Parasponia andersonii]|uniref:3-ketoacyl-CoA synthase n=1 Tax=Parasponia andersonii TaxID=3476 RepID=A0A2P5AD85_PARAD|nr:Very-long-chain 3-ketoacyl-CoA synthase [Parasponia andersonii]